MPIRDARPDDLDEICALIRELARYERLERARFRWPPTRVAAPTV